MAAWVALASGCAAPDPPGGVVAGKSPAQTRPDYADEHFDGTKAGRSHIVQQGDTLYSLAERYYGDKKYWRRIYYANPKRLNDPSNIPVGMKLIIPPP